MNRIKKSRMLYLSRELPSVPGASDICNIIVYCDVVVRARSRVKRMVHEVLHEKRN